MYIVLYYNIFPECNNNDINVRKKFVFIIYKYIYDN